MKKFTDSPLATATLSTLAVGTVLAVNGSSRPWLSIGLAVVWVATIAIAARTAVLQRQERRHRAHLQNALLAAFEQKHS